MTIAEDLSELIGFATEGGWGWTEPGDALFAFVSGDPDDVCTVEDGRFVLRKHERGSISEPLVTTPDLEVLDRFLTLRYGPGVRKARGLPSPPRPVDPAVLIAPPSGVAVEFGADGFAIEWTERTRTLSASALNRVSGARLIEYGREPAAAIRRKFEAA